MERLNEKLGRPAIRGLRARRRDRPRGEPRCFVAILQHFTMAARTGRFRGVVVLVLWALFRHAPAAEEPLPAGASRVCDPEDPLADDPEQDRRAAAPATTPGHHGSRRPGGCPQAARHVHRRHRCERPAPPRLRGRRQLRRRGPGRLLQTRSTSRIHTDGSRHRRRRRPRHPGRHHRRTGKSGARGRADRAARRRQVRRRRATRSPAACTASARPSSTRCPSGLEVEVRRDGHVWTQEFGSGVPHGAVEQRRATDGPAPRITFKPDPEIFETSTSTSTRSRSVPRDGAS